MNGKYTFKRHSFGQRTVSAVLSAVLAATSLSCLSAVTGFAANDVNDSDYGLMENIQDGTILHCFDWKYSDIKAELPNIAAAGFTSVQTSPAQPGGNHDPNASTGIWWWLYQPLSFSIGTNYLGTKEELQELCTEADKYGIKIIVDIVANHFAGSHTYIQEDLKDSKYWRETKSDDYWNSITDKRYKTTHKDLGMPDIVSEDAYVQQCVKSYIQELKSAGVDGLRWDTLKHIQVPSEGCAFFTTVLDPDMYNYGESLGDPGGNNDDENRALMKEYTGLMSVTDDVYGNSLRRGFASGNLESTIGNWAYGGVSADKLVYWGESHDTWSNDETGNGGSLYSYSNLTDQNTVDRVYAVTASRAGATSLYFSRPSETIKNNILAGVKGSTHFTSPEVAEVNKFHNAFSGQTEYCSISSNIYYTERGTKGVVLVNGKSGSASVNVTAHKMADGTYTDHVSGNSFTVSGGKISGTIGSTGIAVVYNTGNTKEDEFTADKLYLAAGKWDKDGATFTVNLYNSNTKEEKELEMTAASEEGTYQAVLPSGSSWTSVKFQRISADGTKVWNYTDESYPGKNNRYTISSEITDWSGNIGAWDTCTICDHVYGSPAWTWNGTSSAKATFTCTNGCGTSKTVSAAISRKTGDTTVTYTATVTFNGQTYTDSKTVEKTDRTLLYLVPSTYWKEADAQFALYTFNSSTNQWTDMTKASDDLYFVEVPDGDWTGMIFVRMNPARTENRWNTSGESGSTKPVWGQTENLTIPADDNNCFTVEENVWTDVTGTWSKYTAQHTHTYGEPAWSWADDNSSAAAAFTCTGCGETAETIGGTVSVSLGDGVCTYTASVTKDGKEYTGTKTVNDVTDTLLSKCWAYQRLADDNQKELYRRLLTFARSVVRGEQTSSVFTYTPDFKTTWTSAELGLGSTAGTKDAYNAMKSKIDALFPYNNKEDMTAVVNALLADCPYEFYWFDNTHGYSYGSTSCSLSGSGSAGAWTITVKPAPSFSVTMQVSLNYQGSTTTSVNTAKINDVKNAVPLSAQTIVNRYKNVSDYQKLEGYAKDLCAAVDYNDNAASGNVNEYDADPWQIVYVFDDDESTKVVCEGYSKAFKYLCDLTSFSSSSIKCYLVTGTLSSGNNDGGGHMWNVVTMEDGKNYLVDVTNSDECTNREYHAFFLKGWTPYSQGWYKVSSRNNSNDNLYYIYDDETKALWGDGILTLSATDYAESPFLVAASLTLTGDISVNLYVNASKELEQDAGAYMMIKDPNDKEAVKYLLSSLEKKNGCYIARCKVNAAQMGEDVSFELYNGSGVRQTLLNSDKTKSFDTFTYSVNTYIEKVKDNDDLLGKTAKAMQNYGAWARQYLVNANKIPATSEIAVPAAITDVNSDDLKDYDVVKSSGFSVPGTNMSLLVESETSIRIYYTGDKIDAAVSSSGKNVDFVTGTNGSYNYIEIPNISAQDIDKTFSISFGDKGTLNVSALSYAYVILKAHNNDNSDICNTVRALFKYNQAAEEFFS